MAMIFLGLYIAAWSVESNSLKLRKPFVAAPAAPSVSVLDHEPVAAKRSRRCL